MVTVINRQFGTVLYIELILMQDIKIIKTTLKYRNKVFTYSVDATNRSKNWLFFVIFSPQVKQLVLTGSFQHSITVPVKNSMYQEQYSAIGQTWHFV